MYNESFGSSIKRGFLGLPTAIRTIIGLNIGIYLVQVMGQIFLGASFNNFIINYLAFFPDPATTFFQPWRLITYMFLHGGIWHILFNLLWLWWMGRPVEEALGPRTFSVVYFGSGIGGALVNLVFAQFMGYNPVIGASGAVIGIMVAFAMLYPRMPIMLFLLPPIEARYVVAGLIAIDLLFIGSPDNTARIVHLGGAGVGYLLMKQERSGYDLSKWVRPIERFWLSLKAIYQSDKQKQPSHMRSVKDVEIVEEVEESELDEILEKISKKGYDGLTKEEKKKLFELSKKR